MSLVISVQTPSQIRKSHRMLSFILSRFASDIMFIEGRLEYSLTNYKQAFVTPHGRH